MNRVALVLTIAFVAAGAACSKQTPTSAGPTTPSGATLPAITDTAITKEALLVFMQERFPAQVKAGSLTLDFGSDGVGEQIVEELSIMGITTTAQLHQAVPADFHEKGFAAIEAAGATTSNAAGLLRDLMIIHNAQLYVDKAWRNGWVASGPEDFPAPAAYGVDMTILETVFDGGGYDGGYDDEDYGDEGMDDGEGDEGLE